MRISLFLIGLFAWSFAGAANAEEYRITTVGDRAGEAILEFQERLEREHPEAELSFLSHIANSSELLDLLEEGIVDFAVVPFREVPALRRSSLLEPFLSKGPVGIRQAINSEVGAYLKADVERESFRVLDFWHVSSSIFASKTPVRKASDLQGLQVYQGFQENSETLLALGATANPMAYAEVHTALQTGSIDSSPVPYDSFSSQALGFASSGTFYVDRLYKPALYAVLVSVDRWAEIAYPDQHHFAKAAVETGDGLVDALQAQSDEFRRDELSRGAVFNAWTAADVDQVRLASLSAYKEDAVLERELIDLAFSDAAATPSPPDEALEPRPSVDVDFLFATDRELVDLQTPETAFSSANRLRGHNFGSASVSLADQRKLGDDLKDVAEIKDLSELTEAAFLQRIAAADDRNILVFIHGYNNAFADSIRRGGAIQADIAAEGLVISYTWPSDGELLSYGYDESSTDTAEQNFKLFMEMLTAAAQPERINLLAHSMGSRLLTRYLASLPERGVGPNSIKFNNVVFAAPDVSTKFFRQKQEEPYDPDYPLSIYADSVTVYSSQHDRALGLSRRIHGDHRLGLAKETDIYLDADITAVDASLIDPPIWYRPFSFATRHSYVFDKPEGVRDLSLLLSGDDPENRPGMAQKTRDGLHYWSLAP